MNIYFTRRTFVFFEQTNFALTVCMFIYVETSNDFGIIKKKVKRHMAKLSSSYFSEYHACYHSQPLPRPLFLDNVHDYRRQTITNGKDNFLKQLILWAMLWLPVTSD